jgi:hypothetical protein
MGTTGIASLDRRTRTDADVRTVTPDEFFAHEVPASIALYGNLVAQGIEQLGAPPLAIEVGDEAWSLERDGDTISVRQGIADGALVVTLDDANFSAWAQQQRSFNGMAVVRELNFSNGDMRAVSIWDSLWMTLLEGWPAVDDELTFVDRSGAPLDLDAAFGPNDDPLDIAHFLREAGFLRLRGWLDPAILATIADDMDRALPTYTEDDGKSWWARLADGSLQCVRMQKFLEHSSATQALLSSDRWEQVRQALAGDDQLEHPDYEIRNIEALVKPVGVVQGASDVNFHRDCHLGRHAYNCSGINVGISVTASGPDNGQLRVVAGSHRVAIPVEIALTEPYLPVAALPTQPGDLTVHLSCTLHEATPPVHTTRKVMYSGFRLPSRFDGPSAGTAELSNIRERVFKVLLADSSDVE